MAATSEEDSTQALRPRLSNAAHGPDLRDDSEFLYIEVPMEKKKGKAVRNGLATCNENGASLPKETANKPPNPDYVLAFDPPTDGARSTILVGDMKRQASSIEPTRPQFRTILLHAKNYGYRTVLYITLILWRPNEGGVQQAAPGAGGPGSLSQPVRRFEAGTPLTVVDQPVEPVGSPSRRRGYAAGQP